jgi:hypothetical protein
MMKIGIDSFVAAVPDALTGENLGSADRLKLLLDKSNLLTGWGSMCLELGSITGRSFSTLLPKRFWLQRQSGPSASVSRVRLQF